ncbi:MAG: hypothetical protein ACI4XF_06035 [Oscillospiraceae bacterium]
MEKSGMEIERKFLIEKYNGRISDEQVWDIVQTYLVRTDPDIQRRVRRITTGGKVTCYYTEKRFIGHGVREENEREISAEEYECLKREADPSLTEIIKRRRIFVYDGKTLEMDEYPFSDKYASIEAELDSITEEIKLPDFIHVIKEVTADPRYSNSAIANNQGFPEDIEQ